MMSKRWAEQHDALLPAVYGEKLTYAENHANGTGPFKLESFEPGVGTVMTRNPEWWGLGQNPHNLDRIVHTVIKDPVLRLQALLSGEVDFLSDPPLADLDRIEGTPGLKLERTNEIQDDLPRPRSGQPGAAILEHQGQEPVCRPARAPSGLSGDR